MKTKKRQKTFLQKNESSQARSIQATIDASKRIGYVIRPSAQTFVKRCCKKALTKGLIKDQEELTICAIALISAGIEEAKSKNQKVMKVAHINEGWQNRLCLGPGNCPPYRCAKRSILERVGHIEHNLTGFMDLMKIIKG